MPEDACRYIAGETTKKETVTKMLSFFLTIYFNEIACVSFKIAVYVNCYASLNATKRN